jgi:hypothetical protein
VARIVATCIRMAGIVAPRIRMARIVATCIIPAAIAAGNRSVWARCVDRLDIEIDCPGAADCKRGTEDDQSGLL